MTVQIFNLSADTTDRQLRKIFEPFGTVVSAVVSRNKHNGRSNRHGLVEMSRSSEAELAVSTLHSTTLDGKIISVSHTTEY
ncbi:RNA-binding protein [Pseudoflavitalea sp. G-6-1-2]|uniref:RNA recognition motif domain-containing protein n=1 Tax=Pseudoflavitalea sp. G-6-1-2 TaxID=2728841 RepID=UPI00146E54B1|nr:RNA-binding protein [Pseudoflavitalea sp. G-6-1-2]NML21191.1 RNA-binding protein [Pseudoflavitalea sp. G-6-1-2]